jgi:hypothetical protein
MAYSDYGGYAYRNGVRVESRSDCTISPEGDTFGSPGMWPGFAAFAAGGKAEYEKRQEWPSGHAVLGDGPIYAVLYKQSSISLHRCGEALDMLSLLKDAPDSAITEWTDEEGKTHRWLNTDHFTSSEDCCVFEVDEWRLEVFFRIEDNHYQYAKLTQPDGNVWHGWAGYGVGAGLEDAGYGYSTEDREDALWELFGAVATP